ncbi:MAG: rRNA maturation RNase YbeY [Alphaproteobacteria bacterium]|nr:MAG: rRNA maturation RNase YbeY [Alphaproteobacteria bacterium]
MTIDTIDIDIRSPLWEEVKSVDEWEGFFSRVLKLVMASVAWPSMDHHGTPRLVMMAQPEISLSLIEDEEMQTINKKFRNKDKPTNVLAFPSGFLHMGCHHDAVPPRHHEPAVGGCGDPENGSPRRCAPRDDATLSETLAFFAGLSQNTCLGDIVLSFETIKRESLEQNKSLTDHITHMFVHGVLHLLGFDHIEERDRIEMEEEEIQILESLGVKNPYVS